MSDNRNPVQPGPVAGQPFNFAQHLLGLNTGRAAKAAFIDDLGTLSYGQLDERVRRLAAALRALGLKREERVLLLMQDSNDWPVSFLGAMYAGLVPVAVNTLLTADDYAYMLEHARAQAVLVSGALLPTLTAAMVKSDH
ncbi:MAG: AMP-binding protein, partial [Leptothrix sp. (in: b-proteobacteria)]